MTKEKFFALPLQVRANLIAKSPILEVIELPAGNNHLPSPLKKGERILNADVKQSPNCVSMPKRKFVKVKHGVAYKQISTFDIEFFLPLNVVKS